MNNNQTKDDDDDTVTLPEHNIMPNVSTTTTTSTTSSTRIVLGKNTDPASQLDTKHHDDEHSKTKQQQQKQQQQKQQQQAVSKQSSIQAWSFFLESLKKIFAHEFFSERHHHRTHSHTRSSPTTTTTTATTTTTTPSSPCCGHSSRVPPRVLLQDCKTSQEHFERIQDILSKCKNQSGLLGLESIGLTYRRYHKKCHYAADAKEESITRNEDKRVGDDYNISNNNNTNDNNMTESSLFNQTRLLHMPTNTWITKQNREMYIADGDMYEEVVRMCQEYAQELMMEEASLHWVSVCEEKEKGNPIRILVDRNYPIHTREQGNGSASTSSSSSTTAHQNEDSHHEEHAGSDSKKETICDKDTLLITTGKGKVRAGIFSRQHLLISSIEASTALPMVRDAKRRNMYIAILDPNARGDRYGMTTYQQSMEVLFGASTNASPTSSSSCSLDKRTTSLYILAHSASGSQLARYLLQETNGDNLLLSRIKSIAFTDSNHSIQWLKHHSHISSLFQSSAALYVRSSNPCRDDDWERHKCGDIVDTWRDEHWLHRFGQVPTIWAGTTDHSLTNYTSHSFIWEHFDKCKYCEDRVVDDSVQKE